MKYYEKLLISQTGNAIISVMFITLSCISIISTALYITFNQFQYSQMYKKSSNMDYLAISGAEVAINDINNTIKINLSSIVNSSIYEILSDVSNNNNKSIEYRDNIGFKIKNDSLNKKIEAKIYNILDSKIKLSYKISYSIEAENCKYKVNIDVKGSKGSYNITSKVTNVDTKVICAAIGEIKLQNNTNIENNIFENYMWKTNDKPPLLSNALITNGIIEIKENSALHISGSDIILNNNIENPENFFIENSIIIDNSILNNHIDKIIGLKNKIDKNITEKNILIIKDGEQEKIDIQMFYDDEQMHPSVIIDIRDNKKIKFSSTDKNIFNGIIYSTGQIEFENDMTINGIVISNNPEANSILINEGINLNIIYDENSIINLATDNYILKRYIYDFLNLTNYNNTAFTDNENELLNILGYLKIKNSSSSNTVINNANAISFKFTSLKITDI